MNIMNKKIKIIEDGFGSNLKNVNVKELEEIVEETIIALNEGSIRVAEKNDKTWVVNEWVKKAEDVLWRRTKLGLFLNKHQVDTLEKYINSKCLT